MFATRVLSRLSTVVARQHIRSMGTKSAVRLQTAPSAGSANHNAHDSHSHDDEHHDHPMWEGEFNPWVIGFITWGSLFGGAGIVCLISYWQNKKNGFLDKK